MKLCDSLEGEWIELLFIRRSLVKIALVLFSFYMSCFDLFSHSSISLCFFFSFLYCSTDGKNEASRRFSEERGLRVALQHWRVASKMTSKAAKNSGMLTLSDILRLTCKVWPLLIHSSLFASDEWTLCFRWPFYIQILWTKGTLGVSIGELNICSLDLFVVGLRPAGPARVDLPLLLLCFQKKGTLLHWPKSDWPDIKAVEDRKLVVEKKKKTAGLSFSFSLFPVLPQIGKVFTWDLDCERRSLHAGKKGEP